jgi:hypothetical protein
MMKRIAATLIPVVLIVATASSQQNNTNNVQNNQSQTSTAVGGGNADSVSTAVVGDNTATAQGGNSISYSSANAQGGNGIGWSSSTSEGGTGVAWSDGGVSNAAVDIDTTSINKYDSKVAPLTTYPPYLPIWNHGGWGTINAYFPNGPAGSDGAYQRSFDPSNAEDMRELRRMLASIPFDGPLGLVGGVLYGVVALFGGPDYTHRGRGFEIANSLVQDARPRGKPLVVFIDSYIDTQLLKEAGYAYVGRVSVEGKYDRNWDQVYSAAVADTLPWDVDVLLVSGGMKGVTVGTNTSFPSAGMGYSQPLYSLSMFGGSAKGVTEGKGEAVVSASGYRYSPSLLQRRKVPESLFERIRRPVPLGATPAQTPTGVAGAASTMTGQSRPAVAPEAQARKSPGVDVSKQLYDMAGFTGPVDQVTVK